MSHAVVVIVATLLCSHVYNELASRLGLRQLIVLHWTRVCHS